MAPRALRHDNKATGEGLRSARVPAYMDVFPDFEGMSGIGDLMEVAGALLMAALIIAVLMVLISAIIWAFAASTGNYNLATKGRIGVLVSLGGAVLTGAATAWLNWLIDLGEQL